MFCERTAIEAADAVIAVSQGVRQDVLNCYPAVKAERIHVIHNGIDPDVYRPRPSPETLTRFGIDPSQPFVLFNGRITRQKGLTLLLAAALKLDRQYQLVIVASSPDTPEIAAEVAALVGRVSAERGNIIWIDHFISREDLIHLHSHAAVFVCPSIYEPFGLVILEAMACVTPVVASRVGGIPEIVVDGETGYLVDYDPADLDGFTSALAERIEALLRDTTMAARMGEAGRERVRQHFGWRAIASQTVQLYDKLLS
jgi:alpha-maltose-1-phosphate synthase